MTDHPRKQIREAAKTLLIGAVIDDDDVTTYGTIAADRVYATMTPPVDLESVLISDGPVLLCYCRKEESRREDYTPNGQNGWVKRRLNLEIEGMAVWNGGESGIDGQLDDFAKQIEALMEAWEPEGFRNAEIHLMDTEINVTDSGEGVLGGIFLTYEVDYYAPYRVVADDEFLPDDVFSASQLDPPEQIVDDTGDQWPPDLTP